MVFGPQLYRGHVGDVQEGQWWVALFQEQNGGFKFS